MASSELHKQFECGVCLNVLADPCTLPCGHSVDHYCLSRSLAVKTQCPCCRAPCASRPPEVNVLFRDALALLFPAEISGRSEELAVARAEHAASLAEEARQRAAQAAERAAHPLTMGPGRGSAMFLFQISSQAFSPPGNGRRGAGEAGGSGRRRGREQAEAPPPARSTRQSTRRAAEEEAAGAPPARRQRRQPLQPAQPPPRLVDDSSEEEEEDGLPADVPPALRQMLRGGMGGMGGMPIFNMSMGLGGAPGQAMPAGLSALVQGMQRRLVESMEARMRGRASPTEGAGRFHFGHESPQPPPDAAPRRRR